MNPVILPKPQYLQCAEGTYPLGGGAIILQPGVDTRIVKVAARLQQQITHASGSFCGLRAGDTSSERGISIGLAPGEREESYTLRITHESVQITGADAAGCFYGVQTLMQLVEQFPRELPCLVIRDHPDMRHRGFYHDTTRGRIPTVAGVKDLVDRLARYKINSLQLYVEHSFAFLELQNGSDAQRDYLTAQEILEIDQYCYDHFIDCIPSIATFGHLYELLNCPQYRHLCEIEDFQPREHFWKERMLHHTIDADNPQSLLLIQSLIDQYLPLFRSNYFNICGDETFDLCTGRNAGKDAATLYMDFVGKVCDYVQKKGKTVMLWGDIILQHPQYIHKLPEGAVVLNWDYSDSPSPEKAATIAQHGIRQILCPGTTSWARLVEDIGVSRENIRKQAELAYQYGAEGLLNTNWGDYGHPAPVQCALVGMLMGAALSWNRHTCLDEEFEQDSSLSLWKTRENMVALIEQLGFAQRTATWHELVEWLQYGDTACFKSSLHQVRDSVSRAEQLKQTLAQIASPKETVHLQVAAEGIRLLNLAVELIFTHASFDAWIEQAACWLDQYERLWLLDCKPSELAQIRSFLMRLPVERS